MWVSLRANGHCSTLPKVTFPARKRLEMPRMPAPHNVSTLANSSLRVTWELALEQRPRRGSQHLPDWQSPGVRVVPLPQSLCVPPLNLLPPRNHNACSARPCSASRPENSLCISWLLAKGSNDPATSLEKGVWLCPSLNSPSGRFSGLLPSHFKSDRHCWTETLKADQSSSSRLYFSARIITGAEWGWHGAGCQELNEDPWPLDHIRAAFQSLN